MNKVRLVAHADPAFARGYHIRLATDGRLVALGNSPLRASAARLLEENIVHSGVVLKLTYSEGDTSVTKTVGEILRIEAA